MPHTGNDTITPDDFSEVAFSGSYNDLINKPTTGVSVTLLWTNSGPTGNFTTQSLNLSIQNYKLILIIANESTGSTVRHYNLLPYDTSFQQSIYASRDRQVTMASNSLTIGHAGGSQGYNGSYDNYCIPYKIYGIK